MSEYGSSTQAIALAIEASFVNDEVKSDEAMQAKLLTNDTDQSSKVLTTLNKELMKCDNFMFSVAFITPGGITMLLNAFKSLRERGIKGRILTSTYQYFNKPDTFKRLMNYQDVIDVRIYDTKNFHAKGYIFKQEHISNFIVGSSNLTQHALTFNHEWNIKVNSTFQGALTKEIEREFNSTWERSKELTDEWIAQYEEEYQSSRIIDINQMLKIQKNVGLKLNKMQREALDSLEQLRNEGKSKAILISATGTGKTYLSAFDVMKVKPRRFLFVIHRENVARAALKSYRHVLGNEISMGILSGNSHLGETPADFLFATIQTLSKDRYLEKFTPDYFDYIVIDEVHRAGAATYQKIFDHFKPKFLLGMSATPERTDGFNVAELFDYQIAYEIRLQHAMQYDLLAPFHYFGIQELFIDGQEIDDCSSFTKLIRDERVDHIIENLKYYGHSGNRARGLIFCSRNEEAKELSIKFNELGYKTIALSGKSSEESRRIAIDRLEQNDRIGGLDYILTVDIFNEGIDIPQINQVVMLRPTQSSIIFIQQLGRGLRKADEKDYVVVLDFIGNYQNNYMIPIALSGDRSFNKDKLRRFAQEGSQLIPGCSTINFDEVTKKKIYESINSAKFSQISIIKKEYQNLKQIVGRIPTLTDFYEHGAIDPIIIHEKCDSYHAYLKKYEKEYDIKLSEEQEMMLKFLTKEISNAKRPHEMMIIEMLVESEIIAIETIVERLNDRYNITDDHPSIDSALSLLSDGFLQPMRRASYKNCSIISMLSNEIRRSEYFDLCMQSEIFREQLMDIINYSKMKCEEEYAQRYDNSNFVLYQKYTRKDVCRLLNWDQDESSTMYGYKIKHKTCPIFVTYEKDDSITYSTNYEDAFINRHLFSWMTRNRVKLSSKEPVAIRNQKVTNLGIHLFIKKGDDEGREHYYLGKLDYKMMEETTIKADQNNDKLLSIVNVRFSLQESVREDVYDYLVK